MTDKKLIATCRSFRRGILGKRDSGMMCAVVAYPLHGFLSMSGIEAQLEEVCLKHTNHVFMRLPDGRVLDPTADQFGGPEIYLGEPQWYHREETDERNKHHAHPSRDSSARGTNRRRASGNR